MIARLALVAAVLCSSGCKAAAVSRSVRESTAEAKYTATQLRCVDAEPALPFDVPVEARRAAHARIDACRAGVRQDWHQTRPDAGGAP